MPPGVPMLSFSESLSSIFHALWGFWPLMFLAAIEGALNRSRKGRLGSNIIRNLLLAWGLFAIFWVFATINGLAPQGYVIPQPLNALLFWLLGLGSITLKISEVISGRLRIRRIMQRSQELNDLASLSSAEFERVVAETYTAYGNRVEIVAAQGDHGIDLVVYSPKGEKYVVQCKRWKGKVGEPVVRDFYGAMQHENAVEGAIITTGDFTPQALAWAKDKPIRLYDGREFLQILNRAQQSRTQQTLDPKPTIPLSKNPPPCCPQCGSPMVLRTARQGSHQGERFYGCSNYPKCRGIIPINEI